jgi:hypothetical protein
MTGDIQEFYRIQRFVAACRRQWPGAMIVLRPNQNAVAAGAPHAVPSPNPHQKKDYNAMVDNLEDDAPTEADLDRCYGSKYLSATDVGGRKIRTRIAKIWIESLQQQGGKPPRSKFVVQFANVDKPMVLNSTNKNTLVDGLGRSPAAWTNAEVGILTEVTSFGGKSMLGLRLRIINRVMTPKPAPAPEPEPAPVSVSAPAEDTFGDSIPF